MAVATGGRGAGGPEVCRRTRRFGFGGLSGFTGFGDLATFGDVTRARQSPGRVGAGAGPRGGGGTTAPAAATGSTDVGAAPVERVVAAVSTVTARAVIGEGALVDKGVGSPATPVAVTAAARRASRSSAAAWKRAFGSAARGPGDHPLQVGGGIRLPTLGALTGEQLGEDDAEGVDVAAYIGGQPGDLLGREVPHGARAPRPVR